MLIIYYSTSSRAEKIKKLGVLTADTSSLVRVKIATATTSAEPRSAARALDVVSAVVRTLVRVNAVSVPFTGVASFFVASS